MPPRLNALPSPTTSETLAKYLIPIPMDALGLELIDRRFRFIPPLIFVPPNTYRLAVWAAKGADIQLFTITVEDGVVSTNDMHADLKKIESVWSLAKAILGTHIYYGCNGDNPTLLEYDPVADTFETYPNAFGGGPGCDKVNTVYSLDPGVGDGTTATVPKPTLALGGQGPCVSLFRCGTKDFNHYGRIDEPDLKHSRVTSIANCEEYIYAIARGTAPDTLFSLNKQSNAKTKVYEVPAGCQLQKVVRAELPAAATLVYSAPGDPPNAPVSWQTGDAWLQMKDEAGNAVYFALRGADTMVRLDARNGAGLPRTTPDNPIGATWTADWAVEVDVRELGETVQFGLTPSPEVGEITATISIPTEAKPIQRLAIGRNQTVLAITRKYGPVYRYHITQNRLEKLARVGNSLTAMDSFGVASLDDTLYFTGYPNVPLASMRPDARLTDREPADWASTDANPRLLTSIEDAIRANTKTGVAVLPGADDKLWVVAMKHRYERGFVLVSYDPHRGGPPEAFDDDGKFDGLQVSWISGSHGPEIRNSKILISTYKYDQEPPVPDLRAKLFVFSPLDRAIIDEFVAPAEVKGIGPVCYVQDCTKIVGLIPDIVDPANYKDDRTTVFSLDLLSGASLARTYSRKISLYFDVGSEGTSGVPRQGPEFLEGPDGFVWTMMEADANNEELIRIDPATLAIQSLGSAGGTPGHFRFVGNDLYLAGTNRLRRIRNAAPMP